MLGKIVRRDALNLGGAFLTAYGFIAFFCFIYLVERWAHAAPTSPDATHGYLYPHNEHGAITYFSGFQSTSCALLFSTSIPLAFVGVLLGPKRNVVFRNKVMFRHIWVGFRANWDPDDPKRLQLVGGLLGALAAPILVFGVGPTLVDGLNAAGIVLSFG